MSRENLGNNVYNFCLRNNRGEVVYAEVETIEMKSNMEAKVIAILKVITHYSINSLKGVIIETNSLGVTKMVNREWRIPWQLVEEIQHIQEIMQATNIEIHHLFWKVNQLANETCDQERKINMETER